MGRRTVSLIGAFAIATGAATMATGAGAEGISSPRPSPAAAVRMRHFSSGLAHPQARPTRKTTPRQQQLAEPITPKPLAVAGVADSFGGAWSELGPAPIAGERCCGPNPADTYGAVSGKVSALAVDPTNGNVVYAGSAGGGIWKSADAGSTWSPLTDDRESLAIGALAIDATGQVIYAGTGEGSPGIEALPGQGVLKSTDGGAHWVLLGNNRFSGVEIDSIAIDRTTSGSTQRVFAATPVGLFTSTDGGVNWTQNTQILSATLPNVVNGAVSGGIINVIQDPVTPSKFWAALSDFCATEAGNIAISTDGGNTWEDSNDFIHAPLASRIGLAVGTSGIAYAALATCDDSTLGLAQGQLGELDQTFDGGSSWRALPADTPGLVDYFTYPGGDGPGGWHSNVIGVDPVDPMHAVFGGVQVMATVDGGSSFRLVGPMEAGSVVHPDQHAIAFTGFNSFYIGNDGGVWRTLNLGGLGRPGDWTDLNQNLRVVQFYAGSALDTNRYLGGAQDNGSPGVLPNGPAPPAWREYLSADGGYTAIDPTPGSTTIYAEHQEGYIHRGTSLPTGSPDYPYDAFQGAAPCWFDSDPACAEQAAWAAPFLMDPVNPARLIAGRTHVYVTTSGGVPPGSAGWRSISPDLTSGQKSGFHRFDYIATLAQGPPGATNTILSGSRDGLLYRTVDSQTWINIVGNLPRPSLGTRSYIGDWIRGIAMNPNNTSEVWVALGGLNVGHVWHTTNVGAAGGPTWVDISGSGMGGIPNFVVTSLVVDPINPSTIYIGTTAGAMVCTTCAGAAPSPSWARLGTGLPNAQVDYLSLTRDARNIVAWTHGRGAWQMSRPAQSVAPVVSLNPGSVDFGTVDLGTSSPSHTVTLTNSGNADLHVQSAELVGADAGQFQGTDSCSGHVVAAGLTCSVQVKFAPTVVGPLSAGVSFSDDAAGSPQLVALSGTGRPIGGSYNPLVPDRILDTRTNIGDHPGPLGPGQELTLQVTGRGGVPSSGVSAVVMNVTVTGTTASSYLTVYPTGVIRPVASNLNWSAGTTVPNLVEVGVGTGGQVTFFNAAGSADVLADVSGWVGTPENSVGGDGLLNPLLPARLLDTRTTNGGHLGPVRPGETVNLQVTGRVPMPRGVEAVVLNVTVTDASAPSYLTVWTAGRPRPNASNLNFLAGQTVPNRVIVEVSEGNQVSFYNAAGSVDVIVDVNAAITNGLGATTGGWYVAHSPIRVYDSRAHDGPLGAGEARGLQTVYDPNQVTALVLNVTVTNTSAASFLTVWPGQSSRPLASDLNWVAGLTVPNLVVVALGADGGINVYNAAGSTDVIIDEVGLYAAPGLANTIPATRAYRRQ